MPELVTITARAIRKPGGKWHRGGRYDYPGETHCPTGLELVLAPRNCETGWASELVPAHLCRKCFAPPVPSPETDTLEDRHEQ